jgi:hypothetical protein
MSEKPKSDDEKRDKVFSWMLNTPPKKHQDTPALTSGSEKRKEIRPGGNRKIPNRGD